MALLGPPRTIQDVNVPRTARAIARIITGTKSTISRLLNFTSGCHLFAFTAGSAGPLSNSAFIAWRRRYASRSRMVFAGRLRLAEINTHDFPASIKSNNRRSSSGVQLLWRRAAPVIVLPNLVSKVMAYYLCTVVQTFCRTGRFPIFATPDLALKSGRGASAERRIRPTLEPLDDPHRAGFRCCTTTVEHRGARRVSCFDQTVCRDVARLCACRHAPNSETFSALHRTRRSRSDAGYF